jgi:CxxC-x17-CxxC domain-containing protein
MSFTDRTLQCVECGQEFVFSAADQEYYQQKGYSHEPKRCLECRRNQRMRRRGGQEIEMHEVVCAECGRTTQVPFKPTGVRPVYCRECFEAKKGRGADE